MSLGICELVSRTDVIPGAVFFKERVGCWFWFEPVFRLCVFF